MVAQDKKLQYYRPVDRTNGITILANHCVSCRLSNSADISGNLSRGLAPVRLEEKVSHRWAVLLNDRRIAGLQIELNGEPPNGRKVICGKTATAAGLVLAEREIAQIIKFRPVSSTAGLGVTDDLPPSISG